MESKDLNITAGRRGWRIRLKRKGSARGDKSMIHETAKYERRSRKANISDGNYKITELRRI